jgi:DtxR family Mn-dependent transcriptional regulator
MFTPCTPGGLPSVVSTFSRGDVRARQRVAARRRGSRGERIDSPERSPWVSYTQPRVKNEVSAATTAVVDDYLQMLHYFKRDGQVARAARLAERLNVSAPTVAATLQRMERDGLIEHGPGHEILLTAYGEELGRSIVRRHALAERFLTDMLQMPWHQAHEEGHVFEHALTPKIEAYLLAALNNPTTCPHGNPIPGLGVLARDEFPLSEATPGDTLSVQRITEDAELEIDLLRYLQEHGIEPGVEILVREVSPFNELLTIESPRGSLALSLRVAALLRVRREQPVAQLGTSARRTRAATH